LRVGSVSVSDFLELQGGMAGKGEQCWPCPRCEGGLVGMVRQIPRFKAVAVPRVSFLTCLIQWMIVLNNGITSGGTGQISAVTFCVKTRTKANL
jgi:hypothetical protein